MIYSKSTKEAAKKLHQEARDRGHTALSYLMVFRAYKARGHNDESFLLNMEFRAIYSELCTLDDIEIVNYNRELGVLIDAR